MIARLRRWIARVVALGVMVLTLGRVRVEWEGVEPVGNDPAERTTIVAVDDDLR